MADVTRRRRDAMHASVVLASVILTMLGTAIRLYARVRYPACAFSYAGSVTVYGISIVVKHRTLAVITVLCCT
jgi:uncharacterized membrane protein YozB (DUF420 family)